MAFLVFRIVKCLGISIIRLIISVRLNGMNYLFELMKQARYEGIIIFFNQNLSDFIDKTVSQVDQSREK